MTLLLISESDCTTVSGKIQNEKCIFPFEYKGTIYHSCPWAFEDKKRWCSTKVDEDGKHLTGNWGHCGAECPIPKSK